MQVLTRDNLIKWRRDLHQNPELSIKEYQTKEYIKTILNEYDVAYEEVLETGLIVTFMGKNNNKKDRTIIFRADIDALPIQEENDIEFKSKNPGVMHACGHDGHTTILLASVIETKKFYEDNQPDFNSLFIFQPAEETIGGARMMIDQYDFSQFNIESSYAIHLNPDFAENTIISKAKEIMASATEFRVKIKGLAAHVGLKHKGIDAINIASVFYQELLKLNTLNLNARDINIIHVGKLWAGDALNIVAKEANLEGTIRTYSKDSLAFIQEKIKDIAKGLEIINHCKIELDFGFGYDAVINDHKEYEIIKAVCQNENIDYIELEEAYLYGEDFSAFRQVSPINYSFLGIRNEEKGFIYGLHTPKFNFDENILETGVNYFVGLVKYYGNQ